MKILTALWVLTTFSSYAQKPCRPWLQSDKQTVGLSIGEILYNVDNIFDLKQEKESKKFHYFANKWHIKTKQSIIARELLFKTGDKYDPRLLQETERLIRSKSFIRLAEIYPMKLCGNQVTIQVDTNDNWTLDPGIAYGRTGGKTKWALELQEKNLFGFGKSLEFKYKKGIDRTQKSIKYNDDNLFGSRNRLDAVYANNSDGKLLELRLYRPFFSLDSKTALDLEYLSNELITPLYERGEVEDDIGQTRNLYSLSYAKLFNRRINSLHRYNLGFTSDKSTFFQGTIFPDTPLPQPRSYQYPWFGYEYFQEDYIERVNFNSMDRQEDISLGHHFKSKLGKSFSDSNLFYDIGYTKGLFAKKDKLVILDSFFNGIYAGDKLVNSHLGGSLKWYHFQKHNKIFFASISFNKANNLFPENRQYLGGDSGLRGYPFRYLNGENKVNITIEQRYFYHWYPLKTFQFASAIFIDSGAAWNNNFSTNHVTNIGIGLRLVPTRTSSGKVLHLDLAFPIDDRDIVGSWQLQLRTKKSF